MDPQLKVVERATRPRPAPAPAPQPPKLRRRRWMRLAVLAIFPIIALIAWYFWSARPPLIGASPPQHGPAVEAIYATGVVEPVRWARVSPVVKGRIAEIFVEEGQHVDRGTLLARLDLKAARANLAEMEARLRFAQQEVARLQPLVQRDVVSRQAYEKAVSDLGQAEAAVAQRRQLLNDLDIVAPISGAVLRKDGEVGEVADTNTVLFWIGDLRPLWITADVDEEDIPQVRVGQRVLIKADAFPNRVLDGHVSEITPKGDPVLKSYRVRVGLPDDTPLRIGMSTEINIVVREEDDALLVPNAAVRDGAVFVVADGKVRRQTVQVGVVGPRLTEIRQGVAPEDVIVSDPPPSLRDGLHVRLREAKG